MFFVKIMIMIIVSKNALCEMWSELIILKRLTPPLWGGIIEGGKTI